MWFYGLHFYRLNQFVSPKSDFINCIPRCFCELTDSMVCSCIETAMLLLAEVMCFEPATNACVLP